MGPVYEMVFWLFVLLAAFGGFVGYQGWRIAELERQVKRLRSAENARSRRDFGRETEANDAVLGRAS